MFWVTLKAQVELGTTRVYLETIMILLITHIAHKKYKNSTT